MGLFHLIKQLFFGTDTHEDYRVRSIRQGDEPKPRQGYDIAELARRLDLPAQALKRQRPDYHLFTIAKANGGVRNIHAPSDALKQMQRTILRRLLARLAVHPAAHGFEKGRSIVTNAQAHVGKAVVLRMDIQNFFNSTGTSRVKKYFRAIGWNEPAAKLLVNLCTYQGSLPQGAPTSPRLSNLVNYVMDVRLTDLAASLSTHSAAYESGTASVAYTRYADDLTFSFATDDRQAVQLAIYATKQFVGDLGYRLHQKKKLRIMRRHDRQIVTGLVVNDVVNLPRAVRRRLRAVEHHIKAGRAATLSLGQLAGWHAMENMIVKQSQ